MTKDDPYDHRRIGENPNDEVAFICDIPVGARLTDSLAKKISAAYEANGRKPLSAEQMEEIVDSEEVVPEGLAPMLPPNIGGPIPEED